LEKKIFSETFFLDVATDLWILMLSSVLTCVCIYVQIPVYRGTVDSIVETVQRAESVHGGDGFGDFHYPDAPDVDEYLQKEHAVNYLTRITSENPGLCCTRRGSNLSHRKDMNRVLTTRNF
jgi:inosine-uridine nucleoside N-ribohydrolase